MTYKDPWNGWLYRVSPAPDEDGLYHIKYRDPTSSVMFKLWPPMSSVGCTMPESLEEVLAARAKKNGWVDADAPEPVDENAEPSPCNDCRCPECDDDGCQQAHCNKADKGLGCMAPDDDCPTEAPAPEPDGELPGDASAMPAPASAPDLPETAPAGFDYSGLDAQTVADLHLAEREYAGGKKMAEMGLRRMADAVAIAHDSLFANCEGHNQHSEDTFSAWCKSIGLKKDAAYRMLQVSKLMESSTPREQKVLEELSPSLLYSAAKPSAPEELVQAVKDGDITTNKQYQDALAQLKAKDTKITELIEYSEASDRRAEEAEHRAREVEAAAQSEHEGASALLADEQRRRQAAEQARIAAEGNAASAASSARAAEAQAKEATARIAALEKEREQHIQWLNDYQEQVDQLRDELCSRKPQQVEAQVVDQDELQRMAELAAVARVIESARESVEAILKRALASVDEVNEDIYHAIQDLTVTLSDYYEAAYDVIEPTAEDAQDGEEAAQDDA